MATAEQLKECGSEVVALADNENVSLTDLSEQLIDCLGAMAIRLHIWPSTVLRGLGHVDKPWPINAVDQRIDTIITNQMRKEGK